VLGHPITERAYAVWRVTRYDGAITDGVDLRGYYVWSLIDNFEWAWGYDKRFGVVRVDFDTQQRTIKDSGQFYQRVVEENALPSQP